MALGTPVTIEGVLTTAAGMTETGRGAFVQDDTAGIALYLPTAAWPQTSMGHLVRVHGSSRRATGR